MAGSIDPARQTIHATFALEERHLAPIVEFSPFLPDALKPIVLLGFVRFFQGDFISAAFLLIPQLEPCLRQILKFNGHEPSKRRDNDTEEDLALSGLFDRFRPQLEEILTAPIAGEIDRLFNATPGPRLRHLFAHGQIGADACFEPDIYYADWLIYRLCCLFLLRRWDQAVRPLLEEAA